MRELRLVLLGLAALMAIALGVTFLMRAFQAPSQSTATAPVESSAPAKPVTTSDAQKEARAAIDRSIAETPDYARFFDRMRLVFPSDYDTILDGLASTTSAGKDINVDTLMANAIAALRRAHGTLAAQSTDGPLQQIFNLQLKELQVLGERDPHLCVAFLYGANGAGFLAFAADHRQLIADAAIAGLDAMNSGRSDHVERGAPSDGDFQALDKALVDKGLSRPEIDALLDGKTADPPIADDKMCKAGQTYLDTLTTLPPDVRTRLYGLAVNLMAKS